LLSEDIPKIQRAETMNKNEAAAVRQAYDAVFKAIKLSVKFNVAPLTNSSHGQI
jgi:hypothetical protein